MAQKCLQDSLLVASDKALVQPAANSLPKVTRGPLEEVTDATPRTLATRYSRKIEKLIVNWLASFLGSCLYIKNII